MLAHFKLDLGMLTDGIGENNIYFAFTNITNLTGSTETFTQIDMTWEWNGSREFSVLINDEWEVYDEDTLNELFTTGSGGFIEFDGEIYTQSSQFVNSFITALNIGFLEIRPLSGDTAIILYRLNDERDAINKNLTFVGMITGKFTAPLGIKNIDLDVVNYDLDASYNYVYIPKLKRYYYVTNIQLTTKDYTRLQLNEDVLMSWADLIKSQEAFITRYGKKADTNALLYDERYPVQDTPSITNYTITNLSGSNIIQFKYLMESYDIPNVLYHANSEVVEFVGSGENIEAPTDSGLPDIQSRRSSNHFRLLSVNTYSSLVYACTNNSAPSSYITSLMLLPFDLRDVFPDAATGYKVYAGDKMLSGGRWVSQGGNVFDSVYGTTEGGFPYIIVADFMFNISGGIDITNDFKDHAPNTAWEIYLPFVGWVRLDAFAVYNKRIMVYYAVDFDSGLSTAYIYNRTDKKLLWSGNCQLGMKLPLTVTNAEEIARQKQATGLNLIMGILSSGVAIGIGAMTSNPVAMVGGVLGIGKSITSSVNTFNQMIEKAQTSFGSSETALYAPKQITVRKITHNKIISSTAEENKYAHLNGYPYRRYVTLNSLDSGYYIEVGEIHFDANDENIYSAEIDEIVALLKSGVIL